jgi:hypothetical protein
VFVAVGFLEIATEEHHPDEGREQMCGQLTSLGSPSVPLSEQALDYVTVDHGPGTAVPRTVVALSLPFCVRVEAGIVETGRWHRIRSRELGGVPKMTDHLADHVVSEQIS